MLYNILNLPLKLAGKTLKEKIEYDGIVLDKISLKAVLKTAFHYKYIDSIDDRLTMIHFRNILNRI